MLISFHFSVWSTKLRKYENIAKSFVYLARQDGQEKINKPHRKENHATKETNIRKNKNEMSKTISGS